MKRQMLRWFLILGILVSACDSGNSGNNANNTNNINNNTNNSNNINNTNNTNNANNINNANNVNIIPHNQNKTEEQALAQLFPRMTFEKQTDASGDYYVVRDAGGAVAGYGLVHANWGFNGEVKTMSGIDASGLTVGVETITQRESWWTYIPESYFLQFTGIPFDSVTLMPGYDRNCSPRCTSLYQAIGVDAVSGATYTSDAIIKNVMDGYLHYDGLRSGQ